MNIDNQESNDFFKKDDSLAVKALKSAGLFAACAVGLAGYGICKGVQFVGQKFDEDQKLRAEIEESNQYCAEVNAEIEKQRLEINAVFNFENEARLQLMQKICAQFAVCELLEEIFDDREANRNFDPNFSVPLEQKNLDVETNLREPLIGGIGAGLAVGAGAIGLVTAFGTAGTGAAISGLTGSSYIHATLAALGGGTLASGGFGMTGGMILLGTATLAPAIAIAASLADSQLKRNHRRALENKKYAESARKEIQMLLPKIRKGAEIFRELNYRIATLDRFFEDLLKMSAAGSELDRYRSILRETASVLTNYCELSIVKADGAINENFNAELDAVDRAASECRDHFYELRAGQSPKSRATLDELKHLVTNEIVVDKEIRSVFDESLENAEEELDITAAWMNDWVVDDRMKRSMKRLLERGVKLKIFCGIESFNDAGRARESKTNKVAADLKRLFGERKNFVIQSTNSHAKVFVCDEKFYVVSSLNVLSNSYFKWNEVGLKVSNDTKNLRELRTKLFHSDQTGG